MNGLARFLTAVSLALTSPMLIAADFYVATNGSDTNPGTEARPFATLERARDEARMI